MLHNLWNISNKDISPRFGFAYNPAANWVVRGGYGIFYFGGQFDNINILQLNPPTAGSLTITNPSLNPIATIQIPLPAALYPTNPFFNAVTLPADRIHPDTYVQNWNLTLSRSSAQTCWTLAMSATRQRMSIPVLRTGTQPDPGPGDIQSRRPYPEYARIRFRYLRRKHKLQFPAGSIRAPA